VARPSRMMPSGLKRERGRCSPRGEDVAGAVGVLHDVRDEFAVLRVLISTRATPTWGSGAACVDGKQAPEWGPSVLSQIAA
jgi:hypothetical protein